MANMGSLVSSGRLERKRMEFGTSTAGVEVGAGVATGAARKKNG